MFSETDYFKSVSSRIMAGLTINGGTGMCNLILDDELIENSEYIEEKYDLEKNKCFVDNESIISEIINKKEKHFFVPNKLI
jgi:hypothetical protein